jgi:hypothetical protein
MFSQPPISMKFNNYASHQHKCFCSTKELCGVFNAHFVLTNLLRIPFSNMGLKVVIKLYEPMIPRQFENRLLFYICYRLLVGSFASTFGRI